MNTHTPRRASSRLPLIAALAWLALVLLAAILAPIIASGRPITLEHLDASGGVVSKESPLWDNLFTDRLTPYDFAERHERGEVRATFTLIPFSPDERASDRDASFLKPGAPASAGRTHTLGTDRHGQDVLSHLIHGSRPALSAGLIAAGLATLIGVSIGALMGYFGGWTDLLLQRLVEIVMGVPLLVVLVLAAAVMPRRIEATMALIAAFTWTTVARHTRVEFMRLRDADFVLAARAAAVPRRSILFRHMLRNAAAPILVDASFTMAAAVVLEATLTFLGLGPAGGHSWGTLLASAVGDTRELRWWLVVFPGGAIFLTALSYNIVGEAARDQLDPRAA